MSSGDKLSVKFLSDVDATLVAFRFTSSRKMDVGVMKNIYIVLKWSNLAHITTCVKVL